MANIQRNGRFCPYKTDTDELFLVKSRKEEKCSICSNIIPKGSMRVGQNYRWGYRLCLNCSINFLKNFITSINNFKKIGQNTLKDIKKNWKKYQAVNTMARI